MARTANHNTPSTIPSTAWDVARETFNDREAWVGIQTDSNEASDGATWLVDLQLLPEGEPWLWVDVRQFGSDEDLVSVDRDFQIQTTIERLRLLAHTLQQAIDKIERLAAKDPDEIRNAVRRERNGKIGQEIFLDC